MARDIIAGSAFIFDVEGTLIDCVAHTIGCWQETLERAGLPVSRRRLQDLSGMDGDEMLRTLYPDMDERERKDIVTAQGERYRTKYLQRVQPFDGIRDLLSMIKSRGGTVALATDCQPDELRHYRHLMKADDLIDHAVCGTEVPHGKPGPALVLRALAECRRTATLSAVMVGDTPFDARAARVSGIAAFGLLSGGHSRTALVNAGCALVASSLPMLRFAILQRRVRADVRAATGGGR